MIAHIQGKLILKEPTYVVVSCHGVGYEVRVSLNTYALIKDLSDCSLWTHLQVKEDAHTLYGFHTQSEKNAFLALISVKTVGPSLALAMLSAFSPEELQHAIVREDVGLIKSVKGIGQKVAQRIILELKDKLGKLVVGGQVPEGTGGTLAVRDEALAALIQLGIPKSTAEKRITSLLNTSKELSVEEVIKRALQGG